MAGREMTWSRKSEDCGSVTWRKCTTCNCYFLYCGIFVQAESRKSMFAGNCIFARSSKFKANSDSKLSRSWVVWSALVWPSRPRGETCGRPVDPSPNIGTFVSSAASVAWGVASVIGLGASTIDRRTRRPRRATGLVDCIGLMVRSDRPIRAEVSRTYSIRSIAMRTPLSLSCLVSTPCPPRTRSEPSTKPAVHI
jgi:hypothetical protein